MKRKILIALFCAFLSIGIVVLLFWVSDQPNRNRNGFVRSYQRENPKLVFNIKVNYKIKSFSGATASTFFVGASDSALIFEYAKGGTEISRHSINYPAIINHPDIQIDSATLFLIDGDGKTIFHKHFKDKTFAAERIPGEAFTRWLKIRPGKIVLRQFIDKTPDQNLVLYDLTTKQIKVGKGLMNLYYDSGMAEDGKLYFDNANMEVVYVFFKRNSYLTLDTNLNLLKKGKTIDTVSSGFTKLSTRKKNNLFTATNAKPALAYNKTSAVSKGILYNYSKLMADNEKEKSFSRFCNVDKYDLKSSKYLGSFYLPKYNDQDIRSMMIQHDVLYVAYTNYIAAFTLN